MEMDTHSDEYIKAAEEGTGGRKLLGTAHFFRPNLFTCFDVAAIFCDGPSTENQDQL